MAASRYSREEVTRAVEALPPLPAVALRVMQVSEDARSSAADLALVVSADPGLTAAVLRAANSAAFRRQREVLSVQEALVVLGFVQARNIAMSSAITATYPPDALHALFRIDAFWRHSLAVAFGASEIARKRRLDPPGAFTAGILHNIGRLAMFYADPAAMDQIVAEAMRRELPLEAVEEEMLGFRHSEIGARLAAQWRLPEEVQAAIGEHEGANPTAATLAGAVAAANRECLENGLLPGYIVPTAPWGQRERPAAFERLLEQVDSLMDLVTGVAV